MNDSKIRAWYAYRQGLDGSLIGKSAAEVLGRTGWARSVGGVGPYLTLFARDGVSRMEVDASVANLEIHELPSARGCTYVLPASDFALGLKVAQSFGDGEMKVAEKLGVTEMEILRLCDAVRIALERGPMDTEEIRESAGRAVRNLGPEGKKKGLTTTLPVALGKLQISGDIRRVPVNGRLDQQRYKYMLWRPNPMRNYLISDEEAFVELARRYFAWIGPATLAEFQWFSGLGVKAAKAAVEPLKLERLSGNEDSLMLPAYRAQFEDFRPPEEPHYVLVSPIDSIVLLRRNLNPMLDPKDRQRHAFVDKDTKPLGSLTDLPSPAIFDRGRIVGLWEYDTATETIVWTAFVKKDKALEQAVRRTEQYVRAQLGDARSFSLDSPKSRAPRVAALRQAAGN